MRYLPFLLALGLSVYAFIDCLQTPRSSVRQLPKPAWLVVVWVPLVGGVAWLVAGRALPTGRPGRRVAPAPLAPDDDPEFLRALHDIDEDHERMLRQWEDDLRRGDSDDPRDPRGDGPAGS